MKSVRQQFADTMVTMGMEDPRLVVLVGDVSHTILQPFAIAFPDRYYNLGVCEQALVGLAGGLAKVGLYPVVHSITPFLVERAFEQIKVDLCLQGAGAALVALGGPGDYAASGPTHQAVDDLALMRALGAFTYLPPTAEDFDSLFRVARNNRGVSYFRIPAS